MTTVFKCDGNMRRMTMDDVRPGVVIRMTNCEPLTSALTNCEHENYDVFGPWSDTLIVNVSSDECGVFWARLVRPYVYADGKGTYCRSWKMGMEDFKVEASRILESYQVVLMSTGDPACFEL